MLSISQWSILQYPDFQWHSTHSPSLLPPVLDAARQIVKEVTEHPDTADEMSELLMERISSLNVDLKKARVYLTTLVSEQNAVYMVRT